MNNSNSNFFIFTVILLFIIMNLLFMCLTNHQIDVLSKLLTIKMFNFKLFYGFVYKSKGVVHL
jgi:hypothetical protein